MRTGKKRQERGKGKRNGSQAKSVCLDAIYESDDPAVKAFMIQAFREEMAGTSARRSFMDVHSRVISRMAQKFSYMLPQGTQSVFSEAVGS